MTRLEPCVEPDQEVKGRVRIAMLTRFYLSGQTTHIVSLAINLVKQGHQVDLYFTRFNPSPHRTTYLRWLEEGQVRSFIDPELSELAQGLSRGNYDVLHAHSSRTFLCAARLSQDTSVPLVVTAHGFGLEREQYRLALGYARRIICVGKEVAASLERYGAKRVVIPHGVDLDEFRPLDRPPLTASNRSILIALIGRYDKFKVSATRAAYDALRELLEIHDNVEVVTLGNWPSGPDGGRWMNLGWVVRPSHQLRVTDIVVGTGLAVREGMAAGNAAIVLGRGYWGVVEPRRMAGVAIPNLSGWTASDVQKPYRETILADFRRLVQNRGYLQFLKDWSREYATNTFDIRTVVTRTLEVYLLVTRGWRPTVTGSCGH